MPDPRMKIRFEERKPFGPADFKQAIQDVEAEVTRLNWVMELDRDRSIGKSSFVYDIKDEREVRIGEVVIENKEGMGMAGPWISFEGENGEYSCKPIEDKTKIKFLALDILQKWKLKRPRLN